MYLKLVIITFLILKYLTNDLYLHYDSMIFLYCYKMLKSIESYLHLNPIFYCSKLITNLEIYLPSI